MTPNYMQCAGSRGRSARRVAVAARVGDAQRGAVGAGSRRARRAGHAATQLDPDLQSEQSRPARGSTADELDGICRIAARVGAWVVSDEIYRGAELDGDETPTVWGRYERVHRHERVVEGLRAARAAHRLGRRAAGARRRALGVHDYTTIAPGALNDRLARDRARAGAPRAAPGAHARHRPRELSRSCAGGSNSVRQGSRTCPPKPARSCSCAITSRDQLDGARSSGCATSRACSSCPGDHFDMDGYLRIGFGSRSRAPVGGARTRRRSPRLRSARSAARCALILALVGFGHVGRRFARLLEERRDWLSLDYDLDCRIVGIATGATAPCSATTASTRGRRSAASTAAIR